MGERKRTWIRRGGASLAAVVGVAWSVDALAPSVAGASGRYPLATTTSSTSGGGVLLILGAAVLVLGGAGFLGFTWVRRKRQPTQCAEQREALELAERAVRYWEAARAHLETVTKEQGQDGAGGGASHATLMANAVEGLRSAMKERDQRQMDLIQCMAIGGARVPVVPPANAQPFFTPPTDGTTPSQ